MQIPVSRTPSTQMQVSMVGQVYSPNPTMTIDSKSTTTDHPVAFVSGLFRGSQLNWAALTKEAFAIYMSIKKLSFYLTDAQILLRSDHKPLEKFLLKNTLNSKVNMTAKLPTMHREPNCTSKIEKVATTRHQH